MKCDFCRKRLETHETGIMCLPCLKGGHARCYVSFGHGYHDLPVNSPLRRAAHHQRLSGRVIETAIERKAEQVVKNVQKNFRTGEIEDQTPVTAMAGPQPAGYRRGMEAVLRQAFNAGWDARERSLVEKDRAFVLWAKDIS